MMESTIYLKFYLPFSRYVSILETVLTWILTIFTLKILNGVGWIESYAKKYWRKVLALYNMAQ
jgi:hypothetical protein